MLHLGLDIGGTKMEAVLLDDAGRVRLRERRPTNKASYQEFIDNLVSMIDGIRPSAPDGFTIGIGLPGAIDPRSGLIKNCNCLVLNGENLRSGRRCRCWLPNSVRRHCGHRLRWRRGSQWTTDQRPERHRR